MKDVLSIWDDDPFSVSSDQITVPTPIPTPSPSVNWAMGGGGVGGIVPGRMYCLDGIESSGKSFFAMECIKEILKVDPKGIVIWYDAEFSFSTHWRDILIPPDDHKRIKQVEENDLEKICDHFSKYAMDKVSNHGGKILAVVVDSIQALISPKEKTSSGIGKEIVGGGLSHAMPKFMHRIVKDSRQHRIPWLIISQVRVDMDPGAKYKGRTMVSTGGQAFKHAVDVELYFDKIWSKDSKIFGDLKNMNDSAEQMGHSVRVKVPKNKVGIPHRVGEFLLHYQKGIVNTELEIFKLAVNLMVITRKGNNYYFNDQLLGVGRDKAAEMLNASGDLQKAVLDKISMATSMNNADADDIMLADEDDT